MGPIRVMLVPGSVLPAQPAYGALVEALGPDVQAVAKDLEVYAGDEPPPGWSLAHAELWEASDRLETLPPEQFMSNFTRLQVKPDVVLPPPAPGAPPPWMAKLPGVRAEAAGHTPAETPRDVNTIVVGAGQAGLAMSYWLSQSGVEHVLLERRETPGGAWHDRWDGFCLNTPNFTLQLPGMPYTGPEPDAFMPRDDLIGYVRRYGESIAAPVLTGTEVTRIAPADGGFHVETTRGSWRARNVVLATGGFQKPKIPAMSARLPANIQQLHTNDYRNPGQLPDGAVLVVGTGQSGGQIAEELLAAGREVHLAVSACPEAPRRYRGKDAIHWMIEIGLHGPEYGVNGLAVEQLPSPAARFMCNPLLSGADGGHDIRLRDLGRRGVRLHGHLEAADDGDLVFSDDLPARLAMVEAGFGQRLQPMFDAYIAAAGIPAPAADPPRVDTWLPSEPPRLDPDAGNITAVIWATGYRLDFSFLEIPVLDEWNYPRHRRGVTDYPGLYAVGLPWLNGHWSAIVAGVGRDAAYIAGHIAGR